MSVNQTIICPNCGNTADFIFGISGNRICNFCGYCFHCEKQLSKVPIYTWSHLSEPTLTVSPPK